MFPICVVRKSALQSRENSIYRNGFGTLWCGSMERDRLFGKINEEYSRCLTVAFPCLIFPDLRKHSVSGSMKSAIGFSVWFHDKVVCKNPKLQEMMG